MKMREQQETVTDLAVQEWYVAMSPGTRTNNGWTSVYEREKVTRFVQAFEQKAWHLEGKTNEGIKPLTLLQGQSSSTNC
jgi:hypothetical protein